MMVSRYTFHGHYKNSALYNKCVEITDRFHNLDAGANLYAVIN